MARTPERLGERAFEESFNNQLISAQGRLLSAKRKLNAAQLTVPAEGMLLFNSEDYLSLADLALIAFAAWRVHLGADEVKHDIQNARDRYNEAYSHTPGPGVLPIGRQSPNEKLTDEIFVTETAEQLRQTRTKAGRTHLVSATTRWLAVIEGGYLAVSGDMKDFAGIAAIAILSHLATQNLSDAKLKLSKARTRFYNAGTFTLLDRGIGKKKTSMVK